MLIRPELGDITAAEFNRGAEAIEIGERAAEAALPQLRTMAVDEKTYAAHRARQQRRDFDPGLVAFLDVLKGRSPSANRVVERAVADNIDQPFDVDRVEKNIGTAYGDGRFQQIDYRLSERNGERGIEIIPTEKPWRAFGKLGFQLDDNFNGGNSYMVSSELTFNNINSLGAEWRNVLRLGRITGLRSEFYQPLGHTGEVLRAAVAGPAQRIIAAVGRRQPAGGVPGQPSRGRRRGRLHAAAGMAHFRRTGARARPRRPVDRQSQRLRRRRGGVRRRSSTTPPGTRSTTSTSPPSGIRVSVDLETYHEAMGADVEGNVARLTADWARAWGRYHLLLGAHLSSALEDDNFFQAQGFLGGFLNLSGFDERALIGNQTALARAVMYRRTGNTSRLFSLPMYVGASLETGNVWQSKDDVERRPDPRRQPLRRIQHAARADVPGLRRQRRWRELVVPDLRFAAAADGKVIAMPEPASGLRQEDVSCRGNGSRRCRSRAPRPPTATAGSA